MGDLFAPSHILLIVIVALLFFGPRKLPELGRAFGKTLKEFKEGTRGIMNDEEVAAVEPQRHNQPQQQPLPQHPQVSLPDTAEGKKL